jgi:hypothetical protein
MTMMENLPEVVSWEEWLTARAAPPPPTRFPPG